MERVDKIFFFHNPKAGGSFLNGVLQQLYPARICPNIENSVADHERLAGRYSDHRGHQVYAGHYGRDVFDAVSDGHAPITNFRNPINRIISLYNYFRFTIDFPEEALNQREFHVVRDAKRLPFDQFVRSPNETTRLYISDVHIRQLTHSLYTDGKIEIAKARDLIDQMPWFYIAERPEQSLRWAEIALGWPMVDNIRVNVSVKGDGFVTFADVDAATIEHLIAINTGDIALYSYAVRCFEQHTAMPKAA